MSSKTLLNASLAEQYLASGESSSLSNFTEIADKAAKILAKKCTESLTLDGLTSISDAAAQSLGNCKDSLSLNGLTSLSDGAAKSLAKITEWLFLDGLSEISDQAARHLGKAQCEGMNLDGLVKLSDEAAEGLAKYRGEYLRLERLSGLSDTACVSLYAYSQYTEEKYGHDGLQAPPSIRQRGWWAMNRAGEPLTQEIAAERLDVARRDGDAVMGNMVDFNEYDEITDEAAEYLAQQDLVWCELANLTRASESAMKWLSRVKNLQVPPLMRAAIARSQISISKLQKLGFFKYAKPQIQNNKDLQYGGTGPWEALLVTDKTGKIHSVGRILNADVEELVRPGLSWFLTADLQVFGLDRSLITECADAKRVLWKQGGRCFPIAGDGIKDSSYDRAAYALVSVLNAMLLDVGSDERAFGVSEGNSFGIAILTEPLRRVISKASAECNKPLTERTLQKMAERSLESGEPPLVEQC